MASTEPLAKSLVARMEKRKRALPLAERVVDDEQTTEAHLAFHETRAAS